MADHPTMNNYMIVFHPNVDLTSALQNIQTYFNLPKEPKPYKSSICYITWVHLKQNLDQFNRTVGDIPVPNELTKYVSKIIYEPPVVYA